MLCLRRSSVQQTKMVPTPQEVSQNGSAEVTISSSHPIVISGMSGVYPNARSVKELADILYNKKNPIKKEMRRNFEFREAQEFCGNIPDIDRFDAQFFKVHYLLAMNMDVIGRKLLELSYQAIYDAGISPEDLSGKKVGVYVGVGLSENEKQVMYATKYSTGMGLLGCSRTMYSNRISYSLNLKGPSIAIDSDSASSEVALELACQDMITGECEAALVGGAGLSLHPQTHVHYGRTTLMCMDGKTKSFDKNADGSIKTEAVNALFLQKAKDANRIYAYVVGAKSEFRGFPSEKTKPQNGFYRDPVDTTKFLLQFYKDINISPDSVEYVEACGSADPEADKAELESIAETFCNNRNDPLLVGSVVSNIGHTDSAHGISAITKVLLGYHTGVLAANMHCLNPRDDIEAINKGKLNIVTDHKSFKRTYAAINSTNLSGTNSHALLQGHYKSKNHARYRSTLPYLINVSARQDLFVKNIIEDLKSRPVDPEEIALLHNIHGSQIYGHLGRGYCVLDSSPDGSTLCLSETVTYFDESKRPLWFVYSGMGSQWAGMGTQLMRIPVFAAAIERCQRVLKPKGIDIVNIITSPDKDIFNNILHSFVGIAAIQIGLTDVLKSVGIVPDMIIGHSVGELGCAYADGCLTDKEMILAAYSRGIISLETPFIRGSMAAVGIGFEKISKLIPAEIEVACHNGPDSSTISGPADKMKEFVADLNAKSIFCKEVPCSNIAFHSRYIAEAGPTLLKYLKEVIKAPRPRSKRWMSTSVPKSRWNEPLAQYSSAEYHTNNLLSPVLFEETARLIPANAVLVEVAPHGLLQAILKRSLPRTCKNIALAKRGHKDNAFIVLDAIGKLYVEGFNPKIEKLYPKVEFPVSTGTPMLSHLVQWVHTEKWMVPLYSAKNSGKASACSFFVSLYEEEYVNLKGNVIKDKILYPFSAALVAVWDTLAMSLNRPKRQISVVFSDLQFYTQPVLLYQKPLKIHVMFTKGNGQFEVMNNDSIIITGFLKTSAASIKEQFEFNQNEETEIPADGIYQYFSERDFNYQGDFRSLLQINSSLTKAKVIWKNDWTTFLDGILQLMTLRDDYNYHISQPSRIRCISIDVNTQVTNDEIVQGSNVKTANVSVLSKSVRCGGVLIEDIEHRDLNFVDKGTIKLKAIAALNTKYDQVKKIVMTSAGSTLRIDKFGDLNSLKWVPMSGTFKPGIEVKVKYASITDFDVKKATGENFVHRSNSFGMDFSGVTESGERVMGLLWCGSLSDRVTALPETLWPVPEHWSLEDAATVPSAYMLALYCLVLKLKFLPGISILVHGGAGALGQAVISIALAHKCEVFTTVRDNKKKQFLLRLFPGLKEDHICNSRDHHFADTIRNATKDTNGVQVVINCVKSGLRDLSLSICGICGIFLDLIQNSINEKFSFNMGHLSIERNYVTVDFHSVFENPQELKKLQQIMCKGITAGWVRPLSRVTYGPEEVSQAFRLLSSSQHRGRVLIKLADAQIPVHSELLCNPKKVHVVICNGDDHLGLQWVDYLTTRGAINVMLHFDSLPLYLPLKIKSWQRRGVNVEIFTEDLRSIEGATKFFNASQKKGHLEGIYVFATPKEIDVNAVNDVIENLHKASRKLKSLPQYFGILSAIGKSGHELCISQLQDDPVTFMDISGRANTKGTVSSYETLATFEQALLSPNPNLVVDSRDIQEKTLLQSIAYIGEISIEESAQDDNISLMDMGLQSEKIPLVVSFLMDQYHLSLMEREVANLTIKQVKAIEERFREPQFKTTSGLETFFSSINDDELLATAEYVFLPTLTNATLGLYDQNIDINDTYLCIVPGLEGYFGRFQELCQLLKLPAAVLQSGLDRFKESLDERAQRLTKVFLKITKLENNKFYLMGYESGIVVALKMAAILEEQGKTGVVFCIGGTPEEILAKIKAETAVNDKVLQNEVARHMFSLITGKDVDLQEVEEVIEGESWLDPWMRALRGQNTNSIQYTRALIEGAYEAIKCTKAYLLEQKPLRSRLVFIRASDVDLESPPESLLERYSQQPVKVFNIPTPLAHLTKDLRCAAEINKNLEPQILDVFNSRNLCESYFTSTATFDTNFEA